MEINTEFSVIANLIGEPARATMLWNLSDGRAYTAGELAIVSDISPQSASNHLNKLVEADFLKVEKQGKHRYYRVAKPEVAHVIESLANLVPGKNIIRKESKYKNGDIQFCRTCYDHLAGKIAVELTQSILKQKILILKGEEFLLSAKGVKWFEAIGIDVNNVEKTKRHFAKPCLDWTERKYHLAGSLGAALLIQMQKLGWVRRKAGSRITILTTEGENKLNEIGIKSLKIV
jgi:DNA-binding transcriptional ArsR family regulator